MDVISDRDEIVYRKDFDNRPFYTIRIAHKNQDGSYNNGYLLVRFRRDVTLKNKTKIAIKKAWLDFYKKDNKTYPYVFISEFNIVEESEGTQTVPDNDPTEENPFEAFGNSISTEVDDSQFAYDENDLPF